jgi:2-phosphosulfolactate phosphatase
MSPFDQSAFGVRFEWGELGLRALAPVTDVLIIVDVLRFTTTTDVAVARGARVLPFESRDPTAAAAFAQREHALLAVMRRHPSSQPDVPSYSLSPASVQHIPRGTRLVLPSPNGATLSRIAAEHGRIVFAGCLRNAAAVAAAARAAGRTIGVIAAGERWPDLSLRPAIEDFLGAGAILSALDAGARSPEAELAVASFRHVATDLYRSLQACGSGRELIEWGYAEDVCLAAELNVSTTAPVLRAGAFGAYAEST